jgi:hypothetical protein
VAHGEIDGGERCREHAVHRADAGRAGFGKVEGERVALLFDGQRDGQRLVNDAIGIDKGLGSVDAVRDRRDMRPHLLGRAFSQLGNRRDNSFVSVTIQDGKQPLLSDVERGRLSADVADALVGDADVGADDRVDFRIEFFPLEQFHRRQP